MLISEMKSLRGQARREVLEYRRNRDRLAGRDLPEEERARLEKWSRAVTAAYTYYKRHDPERARAMVRMFGLYHPVPRRRRLSDRIGRLMLDLNVSEATLYRWQREMLDLVVLNAVETGALSPFGPGKGPLVPEEQDKISTP